MIFVATLILLGLLWLRVWNRFHDPLHPLILLLPQFMFLYGWMPLQSVTDDERMFSEYVGGDFVYVYQGITLLLILTLAMGVSFGTKNVTVRNAEWSRLPLANPERVRWVAISLGFLAIGSFAYILDQSGGFAVAYGRAYGGGWAGMGLGQIQEMPNLGLLGAVLIFMSRTGHARMRAVDWALVILCVSPTLIHALLGARRGPTFLALLTIGGGYIYFMRKRISMITLIAAGSSVGFLILFLVANRDNIYLGSDLPANADPLMILKSWNANEYLIGSATVRLAEANGSFWGARELIWLTCRGVPKGIWSTCYTDFPEALGIELNLWLNGGVDPLKVMMVSGWLPSVGSAEGYTASLWLEFQYFAPVVSFFIGWFYGHTWARARVSLTARVIYPLLAMLSIYLIVQSLDPWLYRVLLLGLPSYWLLSFVHTIPGPNPTLSRTGHSGGKSQRSSSVG